MPPISEGVGARAWLYAISPDPDDVIAHGLKTLYQPLAISALPDDLALLLARLDRAASTIRETAARTAGRTKS